MDNLQRKQCMNSGIMLLLSLCILSGCGFQAARENVFETDSIAHPTQTALPTSTNPQHVVDYFNILKSTEFSIQNYNLVKNAGDDNWKCYGVEDPEREYSSVIDLKNGYIKIDDDGTGGGNTLTEFAIFKTKSDGYLMALNQYSSSPAIYSVDMNDVRIDFYTYNQKITQVTSSVFTPVQAHQLGDSSCFKQVYYTLPQRGTSIVAKLYTDQCSPCNNLKNLKENMEAESFQRTQSFCSACCGQTSTEIVLQYDQESQKFIPKK